MIDIQNNALSSEELLNFLKEIGTGIRPIDDPFFEESYTVCKITRRTGITIEDEEESCHNVMEQFGCNIVGCKERFQTLFDYEIHYNGSHRYTCQNCKKTLPTPRILDIHIQESHDSFFQVMAEKQPMYQCYESECELKFMSSNDRRSHCISIHKFPKKFRYDELVKCKSKPKEGEAMNTEESEKEIQKHKKSCSINKPKQQKGFAKFKSNPSNNATSLSSELNQPSCGVTSIKSSLMFLPRQVQQKSFVKALPKNTANTETNALENDSIMDIADVLPDVSTSNSL